MELCRGSLNGYLFYGSGINQKQIKISTEVFAKLRSFWRPGEESEDDILRRILSTNVDERLGEIEEEKVLVPVLEESPNNNISDTSRDAPRRPFTINRFETADFRLSGSKFDVDAYAIYQDSNWIVLAGSKGMINWIGKETDSSYESLHAALKRDRTIEPISDEYGQFSKDYTFTSPSAASAVIVGRSDNGRNSWVHVETGETFT